MDLLSTLLGEMSIAPVSDQTEINAVLDSLQGAEFLVALEDALGGRLPLSAEACTTFGELAQEVERYQAERPT